MLRYVESVDVLTRHCIFLFVLYGFGMIWISGCLDSPPLPIEFFVHLLSQHFLLNFFPGSPSMKGASPKFRPW